ncbi:MAG: nicotinate-nucleotide adenylyltransferase [bacterium]|nr:nicotinate-nucleotide adenylyltransferase [Acidimicrobiia bacterium]MCY4650394.1 nicotinate-nucleotide adenylyltransferase [bacterium]
MRRAVLGGTFDPPHLAHLVLAEAAYRQLGVSVVELIPTGNPWWKSSPSPSAAHHRLEMVRRAAAGVPYWTVNDCEVRREGASYMVDTLQTFAPTDEIYLVLGADAAMGIRSWMRWQEVVERVRLVVAARPGTDLAKVEEAVGHAPAWLQIPRLDISSEQIRRLCRSGQSIRFLVPEPVLEYIRENRLYG